MLKRILRAVALVLFIALALFAPIALLPLAVRWPARCEDAVVELRRGRRRARARSPAASLR